MNLFLSVCCTRDLNIYRALPPVTFESLGILLLSIFHLLKNSKLKLQWKSGIIQRIIKI